MTYNIPDHISGDTWQGVDSIMIQNSGIPTDLRGSGILMQFRSYTNNLANPVYLELSNQGQGIITPAPELGILSIQPLTIDLPANTYEYSLQVTFPSGESKTYLQGKWKILPNAIRAKYKNNNLKLYDLNVFYGADALNVVPNNQNEILQLTNFSSSNFNVSNFDIIVPANSRRIIIAYPNEINDLTNIIYKDFMNMPVLDKFTKKTLEIDKQTSCGIVKVLYKIYYYISSTPYSSFVTYNVSI